MFWSKRRVAITGNTGFKGSWLSHWLLSEGARVSGYALAPETDPNLFSLLELDRNMFTAHEDVRDAAALSSFLSSERPEVVFHLASQALVRRGYAEPALTYGVNVMGLVNLLEAIRRCDSVRAVVIVTSDKCYENNEWLWAYRETEALGGRDPYSNSKACAELVTRAYRDSYFIPRGGPGVATARAGNVIGGGDWSPDRLVPDIITAIANREPAQLRSPDAIRPWQHVFEPLAGYLLLAQRLMEDPLRYSGAWNFGPDETDLRTVGELADALLAAAGQPPVWRQTTLAAPHEAHTLRVDSSKAHRLLGWRPRLDIATALGLTASWYAAWLDGKAMREESDAQLAAYRSAVPALSN